jgi:acetyltransferase-like isoleucine patch superfamily enzyme
VSASLGRSSSERRLQRLISAGRVTWGRHSYGTPDVLTFRGDTTRAHVGSYVSIAHGVRLLLGGNHRVDWVTTFPLRAHFGLPGAHTDGHPSSKGDIVIGNDVWLGYGCTILSGVNIGHGAVVGANSTVTRPVRPYAIMVGSPAREVRRRFSDDEVDALLQLAWWDWPDWKVQQEVDVLCSPNVQLMVNRHQGVRT